MDNRYEIAEQNGMSREFADWFFDNKKAGCGSAWFVMMAVMWEGWKGSTAMLQGANDALTDEGVIPATQFKPAADLYEMQFDDGRTCAFHTDGAKAVQWLLTCDGNKVQEYVKLDRYQEALSGNSPVIPDCWVPCSERLPEETKDPDGGATGYLVLYAEGKEPNGGFNVGVWNVTYLRQWWRGFITHWQPLPAAPQQEVKSE